MLPLKGSIFAFFHFFFTKTQLQLIQIILFWQAFLVTAGQLRSIFEEKKVYHEYQVFVAPVCRRLAGRLFR